MKNKDLCHESASLENENFLNSFVVAVEWTINFLLQCT